MDSLNDFKFKLKSKFFTFIIEDPYPEVTEYERISGFARSLYKKPEISVHKAWNDGFNFAKNLIIKELE